MDRERIFIGSFNFDPRSVRYNTEPGLVIRSPTQCASMKVDILNGRSVKATRLPPNPVFPTCFKLVRKD